MSDRPTYGIPGLPKTRKRGERGKRLPRFQISRTESGSTVTLLDRRSGYRRNFLTVDEAREAVRELLQAGRFSS